MAEEQVTVERVTRRLSAVVFVDLIESVRLIQADPEGTVARWRDFVGTVMREDLLAAQGRMVKHTGDGMLLEFTSIFDGVRCALAMQARIERASADLPPEKQLRLRMGAHVADVLVDNMDLYGDGVNLAARLMALGGPGEIVISSTVRDQLSDGLGLTVEDLGERLLKGMERPVRAFRAWPAAHPSPAGANRQGRFHDRPSIAVLPFRVHGADPSRTFLGDLMVEDVIGHLSRLGDIVVISRLSTMAFRDRLFEPRSVAEVLGVRYVLSGTVITDDSRLQVLVELTEAEAGRVIWSERFRSPMSDLFQMQEEIARDIARRVVPYVRQLELQRARAKKLESLNAYECTLRAIDHFHRSSRDDLDQARLFLEAAIRNDPTYATPYAWLAHWYVRRAGQGWSDDAAADTARAQQLADSALERDDTDSLALTVKGLVAGYLDKDLNTAVAYLDRALTINPSEASAWVWSTAAHAWLGNAEEAVRRSERAMELSPFDPRMYTFTSIAGTAHAAAGQYARAAEHCRHSLRLNRMFASTHRILALSLALSGDVAGARAAGEDLLRLEPNLTVERFRARYPGNRSPHVEAFCEGLAMAGIPRQ
jgi:adenylate cyclase